MILISKYIEARSKAWGFEDYFENLDGFRVSLSPNGAQTWKPDEARGSKKFRLVSALPWSFRCDFVPLEIAGIGRNVLDKQPLTGSLKAGNVPKFKFRFYRERLIQANSLIKLVFLEMLSNCAFSQYTKPKAKSSFSALFWTVVVAYFVTLRPWDRFLPGDGLLL